MDPRKNRQLKKFELKFKFNFQRILLIGFGIILLAPIFLSFLGNQINESQVPLSQVLQDIREEKVEEIEVTGDKLLINYKEGEDQVSTKESGVSFTEILSESQIDPETVNYTVIDQSLARAVGDILTSLLIVGVMAAVLVWIFRSQSKGAQEIFSFGRSRAKLFAKGKQNVTFDDVAGVDEAKAELTEVVDFLKHPAKYKAIGARTPKGALLVGPAGVGKTLLARAVAGEAGVPFFSMAGSEFMEMLVGVGASRVRDLFATAKRSAPSIVFIDEIDAIGRQRGYGGMTGGHDEREQTLNQILVEMDGFTPNDNVVVVAATNRGDLLDPALLRPGRFDRRVVLDMPDREGREDILEIHQGTKKFSSKVDWSRVASRTVGFSGADLENMLNEAAILAARNNKKEIDMEDIEEAATKVKLGPARKRLQSKEDKKITAYHEAGHAIVTHFLPKMDPVHRISIVARGVSLGHTLIPPAADRSHETKTRLLQQITAMLGGRVAEMMIFKEMTSGAANDIEQATRITRHMVINFGMSSLGPVDFDPDPDEASMGRRIIDPGSVSPATQEKIDKEISNIISSCYKDAEVLLRKHKSKLDKVAKALIKDETLDREVFESIVGSKNGQKESSKKDKK